MGKYGIREKITEYIDSVSHFGADEKGGLTRLLYTVEWKSAQEYLRSTMNQIGMNAYYDHVGNLFGRYEGSVRSNETIMIGSHIDTVRNGGRYDGQFGIIAGLIAAEYLNSKEGKPKCNVEVASFAEEEGSRFPYAFWGVKNILGLTKIEDVNQIEDLHGINFVEAMNNMGFAFDQQQAVLRKDIKQFIEIHVEQGGVLEREGKPIGVVTGIVGQKRFNIEIIGQSNHAGTTPMSYRKDAVYVMSKMIAYMIDLSIEYGDPLVTTVGSIEVVPNVVNVVPGKVRFTVDIRHIDEIVLNNFSDAIIEGMKKIASDFQVAFNHEIYMSESPVPMDSDLVDIIEKTCSENDLNFMMMHSGAGHDSQMMAQYVPTAMFFVPSVNGISHNPDEYTSLDDLEAGVEAVIDILRKLAY
jgi:allantoate deiminase